MYVLTHFAREPLEMDGGTTFHFVTDGPEKAMDAARAAAGERTVAIAGGAAAINEFLRAGLIDELRLHFAPLVAGLDGHAGRCLSQRRPYDLESRSSHIAREK